MASRRVQNTIARFGVRFAENRFGRLAVARVMPAKQQHRKYARKLRPELVEEAQRRALAAADG